MIKTRTYSPYTDFHTGLLYKIFLFIGVILISLYFLLWLLQPIPINDSYLDGILAFAVLFFGGSFFLFFMHRQFVKLATIAQEIEDPRESDHHS
ncbi:MAG: hypothetical protein QXL17_05105 [Candidatus Thermoplasmatota archaeon]